MFRLPSTLSSRIASLLAATAVGLAASHASAQSLSFSSWSSSLVDQSFTSLSTVETEPTFGFTATTATEAPPETDSSPSSSVSTDVGNVAVGEVLLDDLGSITPSRLLLEGGGLDEPTVVDATAFAFESWDELFEFAEDELGATLIRDASGTVVAATGRYALTGDVVFDDAGESFERLDYVAARLGGSRGEVEVDGMVYSLGAPFAPGDETVSYLQQTATDCDEAGESCIEGHSWLTHAVIYHSVGARTKQISGGIETVSYSGCRSGVAVYHEGRRQCRYRNPAAWEWDPELRALVPTVAALDEPLYLYGPLDELFYEALRNELRVGARILVGPNASLTLVPVTAQNEPKVELGDWTLIRDILPDGFGNTVPIADITGICATHSGSRGEFVRSADGSTGDDDLLCEGGVPY